MNNRLFDAIQRLTAHARDYGITDVYRDDVKLVCDEAMKHIRDGEHPTHDEALQRYKEFHGVDKCHCGEPIESDSCPKCGTWLDIYGRR